MFLFLEVGLLFGKLAGPVIIEPIVLSGEGLELLLQFQQLRAPAGHRKHLKFATLARMLDPAQTSRFSNFLTELERGNNSAAFNASNITIKTAIIIPPRSTPPPRSADRIRGTLLPAAS